MALTSKVNLKSLKEYNPTTVMDKVLMMIYGSAWIIGVSLPVVVFWLYRTIQQIR